IRREVCGGEGDNLGGGREYKNKLPVMTEQTFQTTGESGLTIQSQGTYLITGGLGGLGLEMAKFIAAKGQAKIILANRSAFPQKKDWENIEDEQIRKKVEILKQVEEMGSSIVIKQLDITNEAEVSQFAKSIGSLNGIFHCAGVAGDGFIFFYKQEAAYD
ncbi:SDR family NAD(P)-dependent oxidoreductase, partial [Streptococcus mutans]|uniref:SDR family NAD(P)-dependent oxidoreductase n=1 Tax=Streptococcus mutans TaxID=1309 RepID=UPI001EE9BC31